MAAVVTNLAASVGGLTWCILDYRLERKWSTVGFCSGVIAGLVAITPGSGFVPAWSAVIFGVVGGAACNYATKLKFLLHIDDSLDIFAIHGIGGLVGDLLTGLFAADYIAHLDGFSEIDGGWLNHHWIQLAYQLCDGVTGMAYSFVLSCIILFLLNFIPGLHLRASEQEEIMGMDETEIGEFAYDVSAVRSVHFVSELTKITVRRTLARCRQWPRARYTSSSRRSQLRRRAAPGKASEPTVGTLSDLWNREVEGVITLVKKVSIRSVAHSNF
jgi:Amt family ammonium transporter